MDKMNQNVFSNVLSINPYKGTYIRSAGQRLNVERSPNYVKDQYTISYINTGDFITALIGISKNIPDDDIDFVIESKVYEELALDMAMEYKIDYIEARDTADEKERFFHVFVIDPIVLEEQFVDTIENVTYIDNIIPVPLLLKGLYEQEIIGETGVHAFIYFQENDAFFTIYNDREFVYTKSLKYSFKQMHEHFCELLGEQLSFNDFMTLLSEEGLSTKNSEYQKFLIKLFGELFVHINDVLTYAKRAYELEIIDQIYIGSQIGAIHGLDEYSQTFLSLESKVFDFDYGFDTGGMYVDQVHQLMQIYTQVSPKDRYESNFTIFHRPPPFLQRHSGKLITLSAASLVAAFAYPVTFWTLSYAESLHINLLEQEYVEVHNTKMTREKAINFKLKNKAKASELFKVEDDDFNQKKATLIKIHEIKVDYPMKGKILTAMTKDLNRFKVDISEITYTETNSTKVLTLNVMSKKDKQITDLLEFLTKNRTDKHSFSLETIFWDDEIQYYMGEIKAVIK